MFSIKQILVFLSLGFYLSCSAPRTIIGEIRNDGELYVAQDSLFYLETSAFGDKHYYSFSPNTIYVESDSLSYDFTYNIGLGRSIGFYLHKHPRDAAVYQSNFQKKVEATSDSIFFNYDKIIKTDSLTFFINSVVMDPKLLSASEKKSTSYLFILGVVAYSDNLQVSLFFTNEDFYPNSRSIFMRDIEIYEKKLLKLFSGIKFNEKLYGFKFPE